MAKELKSHKYLIIKADFNDADYSTAINKVTDKQLEDIKPGLAALKKCKGSVEKYQAMMEELEESEEESDVKKYDDLYLLSDLFPWAGDNEIHTIEDIQIFEGTITKLY